MMIYFAFMDLNLNSIISKRASQRKIAAWAIANPAPRLCQPSLIILV